jgi:hypothetical protein
MHVMKRRFQTVNAIDDKTDATLDEENDGTTQRD